MGEKAILGSGRVAEKGADVEDTVEEVRRFNWTEVKNNASEIKTSARM